MFWICAAKSVDNTGMFSLLLSSAYTEPRPSLPLAPSHQQAAWGCTTSWEGHGWDSWPQLTKQISHTIWHHAQRIKQREEEERRGCLELRHLSS